MDAFETLYADRSERAKLRVSDEQRAWFLDQVLTQSFQDMRPGEARDAAMITVHGRMQAYLEIFATEEAFLCHFEPDLRPSLPDALRRYVFATRVHIDDVTDEMALVLVAGEHWRDLVAGAPGEIIIHPTRSLGVPAAYLWAGVEERGALLAWLQARGAVAATEERLEAIRIEHGVARWGREMDPKTFPQEAGVDEQAVHYDKGCYLGQEAMAKIHFRGKVNRRLCRLQAEGPLQAGSDVFFNGQKIGRVTSASNGRGLALVRYTTEPGAGVTAGDTGATVVS